MRLSPVVVLSGTLLCGCGNGFDDSPSWVHTLRLLGVKAEPPEAHPGDGVKMTALAIDPRTVDGMTGVGIEWAACTAPEVSGTGTVDTACITNATAPYLIPLGSGLSMTAKVPKVDPLTLNEMMDATGGLYLPIRLRVSAPGDSLDGIYRLRLSQGTTPNQNPRLAGVVEVLGETGDGGLTASAPLEEGTPPTVLAGQAIRLRATFAPGSAETYAVGDRSAEETLDVTWFSTAGSWQNGSTGDGVDTVLTLDKHLPPGGGTIDLWMVGRDGRGGSDFIHRSLRFQ